MKATGHTSIEKLLSISSEALAKSPAAAPTLLAAYLMGTELFHLLRKKNGFYAFESALHVFPVASPGGMSLEEWNADSLWRNGYGDLAKGLFFSQKTYSRISSVSPQME